MCQYKCPVWKCQSENRVLFPAQSHFRPFSAQWVVFVSPPSDIGVSHGDSEIERPDIVKKILQHLGLWDRKPRPPPKNDVLETAMDTSDSQLPPCEDYLHRDPEYPIEAYAS